MRLLHACVLGLAALSLTACDLDPRPLLQNYRDGEVQPADVIDLNHLPDDRGPVIDTQEPYIDTVYGSSIGSGDTAGATFDFTGTGDRMCVIVDPQSVFRDDLQLGGNGEEYWNPFMDDYPHDDGDIDLLVGLASFYTGTPGVEMGDFFQSFPDSNGVDRAVDLNICLQRDRYGSVGASAGRATPEWCSFDTTPGVEYRVVLRVFSVPVDDDELRYALSVRTGDCPATVNECTLRGDADYFEGLREILPGETFDTVEELYCDGLE
jgi:hypothetical protein